jgi:hypothetical protein
MSESKKEQKFKERELSPIQRFFIICSGADKGIIEQCPTEWNKYTGIGATIFFTGVLAWLSGGYALYTVFRNTNLDTIDSTALFFAIPFGFLWGAVIFNLDRFIVSTFHKSNETVFLKRLGRELLQASPRIILAVIIAITISKPIEIKIFESRLIEQIQQNEIEARKRNQSNFEAINNISGKTQDIAAKEEKNSILQQELADDPLIVKNLLEDLEKVRSELATIQRTNQPKIDNHNQSIRNIRNNPSNYRPIRDAEGNIMYDNNGNIRQSLTQEANSNISSHNVEIGRLRGDINAKQKEVDTINNQIAEERRSYKTQKQAEIDENKQAQRNAEARLDSARVMVSTETAKADTNTKKAFSNNFITQLEALGDLTKITDKDDDIARKKKRTMWWTSLVITLLFLVIELAPILTKLITKRGDYDEILERSDYETMIAQKEIISRKNSEINELLRRAEEAARLSGDVMLQKTRDKLDTELRNNKIILDKIAEYQQELALKAIEKWREDELAKINSSNVTSHTI